MAVPRVFATVVGLGFVVLVLLVYKTAEQINTHHTGGGPHGSELEARVSALQGQLGRAESVLGRLQKEQEDEKEALRILDKRMEQGARLRRQNVRDRAKAPVGGRAKPQRGGGAGAAPAVAAVNNHGAAVKEPGRLSHRRPAPAGTCVAPPLLNTSDLSVDHIFDVNPFVDPQGGAWTQGFEINYDPHQWTKERPLNVFIIPHSHNDPGWLKTVDQYFEEQTTNILTHMVSALSQDASRRFIWAEISYFAMWWDRQTAATRDTTRSLVKKGQLEFVTAGWVMNDEANTHYYAMLDQLTLGNQWLLENVGAKPRAGWAIDPFGHTPTMAYLLHDMGLEYMLIQRVHYEFKRVLAKDRNLEFMWTQTWDTDRKHALMCHMMPFYSYDIPHTCGPEPAICCQFDFARLPGGRYSCPWNIPPQEINDGNVRERAETLLNQYRKKSQLFRTNNVLIPLGDDFRWDDPREIANQFNNYKRIIDHINGREDLHAHVRFATLSEYFDAVKHEAQQQSVTLPSLVGDFFTYADRKDHYWSGYFTSRPFYKHLDRAAEAAMRAAEIIYSLAVEATGDSARHRAERYNLLAEGRRHLGVFQHHDGITGTSKDHVVVDYGGRLLQAVHHAEALISEMASILLGKSPETLTVESSRPSHDSLPTRAVLQLHDGSRLAVFYNPLAHVRTDMTSLLVTHFDVTVVDPDGQTIASQCNPVEGNTDACELWFEVTVPPLGLAVYTIKAGGHSQHHIAKVTLRHDAPPVANAFTTTVDTSGGEFSLEGPHAAYAFHGQRGLPVSYTLPGGGPQKLKLDFYTYGVRQQDDSRSGAYLFIAPGPAEVYQPQSPASITIARGPLVQQVTARIGSVVSTFRLFDSSKEYAAPLHINNVVDVTNMPNQEFVMRLQTDIRNGNEFFTDLNGFQMRRRRTLSKIPLGGNVYPLPTVAFLQDASTRLTLHTHSAMGVASLEPGWLETVLDRRLLNDDNRGLGQGVTDNRRTALQYLLQIEKDLTVPAHAHPSLTLAAAAANDRLNQPLVAMHTRSTPVPGLVEPLRHPLPCDVHLVNLRAMGAAADAPVALVLHRRGLLCSGDTAHCQPDSKIRIRALFNKLRVSNVKEVPLTLLSDGTDVEEEAVEVEVMALQAFRANVAPAPA